MTALNIKNFEGKILVIGPIYDKIDKLQNALTLINNYELIIFNGNLCYPNNNIKERIDLIKNALNTNKVLYNLGNYDLINLKSIEDIEIVQWLKCKPNVIIIEFLRGTYVIVTSGGINPNMKDKEELFDNLETSFISTIGDKLWHQQYNGKHGYVISNNPLTFNEPQFYNFSAQIGNNYGTNTQVYAQEIDQNGLQKTILL